jgi:hypothetical protein
VNWTKFAHKLDVNGEVVSCEDVSPRSGGAARWKGLSPEQRREIARTAARARWAKPKKG